MVGRAPSMSKKPIKAMFVTALFLAVPGSFVIAGLVVAWKKWFR